MTERETEQMYAGILAWRREQRSARTEKRKANVSLPRRRRPNPGGRCGRPVKHPGARLMTQAEKERWGRDSIGLRDWRRHHGLCYFCGLESGDELSCADCRKQRADREREGAQRRERQRGR